MRQRLVVIGNGPSAACMLERLLGADAGAYGITVFGGESRASYDRRLLPAVLAGHKSFEDIVIHEEGWYASHGIAFHPGGEAVRVDPFARTVTAIAGEPVPYDRLVIATGSRPVTLAVPGSGLPGAITFWDAGDVEAMGEAARQGRRAVVIGGGLTGLEAAAALGHRGMDVTVVHVMPALMECQLDAMAGVLLKKALEARGIQVRLGVGVSAVEGSSRAQGVLLKDGTALPADLVVFAGGSEPNTTLAAEAGLAVRRGIAVDETMRTSDPDIFALGGCAGPDAHCYGFLPPRSVMADVVAGQLLGNVQARLAAGPLAAQLSVTGIDVFAAGDLAAGNGREEIVHADSARGVYRRIVFQGDRIAGVVMYGDTAAGPWFFDLLQRGTDISPARELLMLGQDCAADMRLATAAAAAVLPGPAASAFAEA